MVRSRSFLGMRDFLVGSGPDADTPKSVLSLNGYRKWVLDVDGMKVLQVILSKRSKTELTL